MIYRVIDLFNLISAADVIYTLSDEYCQKHYLAGMLLKEVYTHYIFVCMCMYICVCVYVFMCVCVCAYLHECMCICMYVCICVYVI